MTKLLASLAIVASIALASCGPVRDKFDKLTQTVTNPVGTVDIYRAKNVHAAALELANKYRSYCWSKPYAQLMADPLAKPTCQNRRQVVRALQAADAKASAAIKTADRFVRENPTLNATSAITAAWKAVQDFQALATNATAKVR